MSEVLARIRVKETHGIRRFLYPLSTEVTLPSGTDLASLSLIKSENDPVSLQVSKMEGSLYRLDFAISLDPLQSETELILSADGPQIAIPDPLNLTYTETGGLNSIQERFRVALGTAGEIKDVLYDDVPHLREPAVIKRSNLDDKNYKRGFVSLGETEMSFKNSKVEVGGGPICAWIATTGTYADDRAVQIRSEITACKSWIQTYYSFDRPRTGDKIHFWLPLAGEIASPRRSGPERVIYDTGIDGLYGKIPSYFGSFIRWHLPVSFEETIRWEIGVTADGTMLDKHGHHADRIDYLGNTHRADFQKQRWFHLVDGNKAVAVAITNVPTACRTIEVELRGYTGIRFTLDEDTKKPAEIGVCYHFLNDIPAIAAATNPQSILLPPTVEVLPA